ncbi:heme ABC exporter ATP-binding protein CcmA [Paraferrimonas haliotis]|uniref:ABC transporter n=1 Tax=Paraferrimonas haliotis TaxID=2013866 RepID=A0AA37WVA6_9GAMM|nr:heme ABC exporter ATP-binding protein CcmA [Paraferrimonas haliotis]GLS82158.1 ABC transporter [Paraferrimonas haliotis]
MKLVASNLQVGYDDSKLIDCKPLQLAAGDSIHLQGANGSGKTTLLKCLAGLLPPLSGKITLESQPSLSWWRSRSPLGRVVYMHQSPYLYEGSLYKNLSFAWRQRQSQAASKQETIEQALALVGLEGRAQELAASLSGGERKRLALARIWVIQPKLALLDEPLANLDSHSQKLILQAITQLQKNGCGMIITSHQAEGLSHVCQRSWNIQDKRLEEQVSSSNYGRKQNAR